MNQYKKLSFFSVCLLGINSIIGSGIFILPANAFNSFGVYSLWALLFTMVLAILFGLCFSEMAGIYNKDGGAYIYAKETFGDFIGFNVGALNFFSATMTWATTAVAFTQVLSAFFPLFNEGSVYSLLLPSVLIFGTALFTLLGIKETTWSNNIITIAKLIPLFIFCLVGIFYMQPHNLQTREHIPETHTWAAFSGTVLLFFYAFSGFEMIPLAANTMNKPEKTLPKAIVLTLVFVGLFYALILLISIGLLGNSLSYSNNPISEAFSKILGQAGFNFIWVGSLISIMGLLIATSFEGPRSLSPLALDGFLPKKLAIENENSVPVFSVLFMALLASVISSTGSFEFLLKALSFVLLLLYLTTAFAVLKARLKGKKSSFRMPFFPFTPIFTIFLSLYLIYNIDWSEILYGCITLILSTIVYITYAKPHKAKQN